MCSVYCSYCVLSSFIDKDASCMDEHILSIIYCIHVSGLVFLFSEVKSHSSVFENFPLLSPIFMTNNVKSRAWNRFKITIPVPILVPLK